MQKDQESREHIVQLEELVETRTAALAEARAQLELEIAERKRVEAERERLLVTERTKIRQQGALVRLSA